MLSLGRLHLITDTRPGHDPVAVIRAALTANIPATVGLVVQVRVEDHWTDRQAYELVTAILPLCRTAGVTCVVNDRLDVALAAGADGAHVGADDLPMAAARRILGPTAVLGGTCREPHLGHELAAAGASYLGVGPAHATHTKAGLPAAIGTAGIGAVAAALPTVPVIAIGGVTAARVAALISTGAHGVAAVGAVSAATDPAAAVAAIAAAIEAATTSAVCR